MGSVSLPALAAIVSGTKLLDVVIAAFVAGVGLTAAFSALIYTAARASDLRREQRTLAAGAFATFALLALLVCVAGVAFGLHTMLSG